MSTVTAISFKPKATRRRLKKEILSDDFKKGKIFWKNIAENFLEKYCGKFSVRENFLWKIFHLTSLGPTRGTRAYLFWPANHPPVSVLSIFLIKSVAFLFLPLSLFLYFACGPPCLLHYTDWPGSHKRLGHWLKLYHWERGG
jgi:hypothetical protein